MTKDSQAPQAFPYSGVGDELNYSKGMTLRDYFAAKAMQGLLASEVKAPMNEFATEAYALADAMLKARNK